MAHIAASPQIVDLQPEIRINLNRNLMIGVQVPLMPCESPAQFLKYNCGWGRIKSSFAALLDNIRFPPAIDAAPFVTLEASNTKLDVILVVTALCRLAACDVMLLGGFPLVLLAA